MALGALILDGCSRMRTAEVVCICRKIMICIGIGGPATLLATGAGCKAMCADKSLVLRLR
jgi:hypothetical protein